MRNMSLNQKKNILLEVTKALKKLNSTFFYYVTDVSNSLYSFAYASLSHSSITTK